MSGTRRRGEVFRYESHVVDPAEGLLLCHYSLDGRQFEERFRLSPEGRWDTPAAAAAARLVFLVAGVSYYKTAAPPAVDLGAEALTDLERSFLREFYVKGLGEFAYVNHLDLSDLTFHSRSPCALDVTTEKSLPHKVDGIEGTPRALVPFGGGIDSIVTVDRVRQRAGVVLFVMHRSGDVFDAIEAPAAVTGLPVVRAEREIDPQLLQSKELGFLHGHVPVTGILSAAAVLAAVLHGRDAVVMSNEWSASVPTLEHGGMPVNHQWSKSVEFETIFRRVVRESAAAAPDYFSALRDRSELWIAEQFASLTQYHGTFRSCNTAFRLDRNRRLAHWCGQCDKCCFIDLILSPFTSAEALRSVFAPGREPLDDPDLASRFRALLGIGARPFACVGEVGESRAAVLLAARRADRAGCALLQELAAQVVGRPDAPSEADMAAMRRPMGQSFAPAGYAMEAP